MGIRCTSGRMVQPRSFCLDALPIHLRVILCTGSFHLEVTLTLSVALMELPLCRSIAGKILQRLNAKMPHMES